MVNGRYHKDVYFPASIRNQLPDSICNIRYTKHALEEATKNNISLPNSICGGDIFEAEIKFDRITKANYRVRYSKNFDLCLVLAIGEPVICITVWINHKQERHLTLDKSNYIQGYEYETTRGSSFKL